MKLVGKFLIAAACILPVSTLAQSNDQRADQLANCAAMYSVSGDYAASGKLGLPASETQNAVSMFRRMQEDAGKASAKFSSDNIAAEKIKQYAQVHAAQVQKDGNTKSLGPKLSPCLELLKSSH